MGEITYQEFLADWRDDKDFITCHTSGSTGKPKEIELPKRLMEESAWRTVRFFNIDSGSHLHSCISPEFIGGKMMWVRSELTGARLSWETPSNRPLAEYCDSEIDLLAVVPSQMHYLLERIETLPRIRNLIIGGAPLSTELRKKICLSGLSAWETYGMTETASHIALRKVSSEKRGFTPLPGIKISRDQNGLLIIDLGKWGIFHTNDIVEIDSKGEFQVKGRFDNVIITGGKKVHPEEVEHIIESYIGSEVLVYGEKDPKWGEKVMMMVEPLPGLNADIVKDICKRNLSKECIPKEIYIHGLPRTANGKKKRHFM